LTIRVVPVHTRSAARLAELSLSGALCATLALPGCGGGGSPPDVRLDGLMRHVRALARIASENGGTRAAGAPGYEASVRYVARSLRAAGWRVRVQRVPLSLFRERGPAHLELGARAVDEVVGLRYSGSGEAAGRVARVGQGCEAGDYDSFPRGSVAVALVDGCLTRAKVTAAERAGAVGFVLAQPALRHPLAATLLGPGVRIPAVAVAGAVARTLERGRPRVRIGVDASTSRATTRNVVAELPGGDPDEVVIAGGHLDSVPEGPGINDNGSRVAALLGIAAGLGRSRESPGRRVRLAFWGAEELGLIGSRRYVGGLGGDERGRIRAYLNLDVIGTKGGRRYLYGGAGLDAGVRAARDAVGELRPIDEEDAASDELSFASAGIPVMGLFSGLDSCYHRECDMLGNVDPRQLRALAGGAFAALTALAGSR
jgi:Iap family predicted aminopeptidase